MPRRQEAGFTLIELLVVIAIIAILAAVVAPNAFRAIEKAKISGSMADVRAMKTGAISYYGDTGVWPFDGIGIAAAPINGFIRDDGVAGWDGPYLEKWPQLARWGGVYTFENDSAVDWDGAGGGDLARYVAITSVPLRAAQTTDLQLDGVIGTGVGTVRYGAAAPITVDILVSTDVAVN